MLLDWNLVLSFTGVSLVAQMVKNPPAMQETLVWSLGQEDPLDKEMATHSSTLAWRIPWMEKPGGLQSMGSQRVRHNCVTNFSFSTFLSFTSCGFYLPKLQIIYKMDKIEAPIWLNCFECKITQRVSLWKFIFARASIVKKKNIKLKWSISCFSFWL